MSGTAAEPGLRGPAPGPSAVAPRGSAERAARRGSGGRVCYLNESFWPPDTGGLQRHAFELARRIIAEGLELFVVARRVDPAATPRDRVEGVSILRLEPPGQWKGRGWKALAPVAGFLRRAFAELVRSAGRYDAVLIGGLKLLPLAAVPAGTLCGKRCVLRVETPTEVLEDLTPESLRNMRLGPAGGGLVAFRAARNALVRRADRVIAPSAEIAAGLERMGVDPDRIRRIPYGIDLERFRPVSPVEKARLRAALRLPADGVLVVFTGRLAVSKGLPSLIRVWDELARERPDAHLVIVGSAGGTFDPCEAELRAYVRERGLGGSVSLTGEVENVEAYLQAADLFVLPSDYESFGLSIVEALACGLPAVVTRVGVASERLVDGESALLLDPGDTPGLRLRLKTLLDQPERWPVMAGAARRAVSAEFGLDAVARRHLEVFEELGIGPARPRET